MNEIERISDQLRRAHSGEAWHGPSLEEVLEGVTAEAAGKKPVAGGHSIWEIVAHIAVWEAVVRRRLSGEVVRNVPPEQDWPPVTDTTPEAWQNALAQLRSGCELLQQAVSRLTDRQLEAEVPGMGYNVYVMLHGAVQHATYHAGQIALLKKAA